MTKEKKEDISYSLDLIDEPLFKGHPFTFFYNKWKQYGVCLTLAENIYIYNPQLATLLTTKEIKAWNRDLQKEDLFNGTKYRESYSNGFREGVQYFENEYKISPDTLYGEHAETYVRALHDQYFHSGKRKYDGWDHAIKEYPVAGITHNLIREYGYYSGLVHCVKELIRKHGKLFEKFYFDKCIKKGKPQRKKPERRKKRSKNIERMRVVAGDS